MALDARGATLDVASATLLSGAQRCLRSATRVAGLTRRLSQELSTSHKSKGHFRSRSIWIPHRIDSRAVGGSAFDTRFSVGNPSCLSYTHPPTAPHGTDRRRPVLDEQKPDGALYREPHRHLQLHAGCPRAVLAGEQGAAGPLEAEAARDGDREGSGYVMRLRRHGDGQRAVRTSAPARSFRRHRRANASQSSSAAVCTAFLLPLNC